MLSFAGRFFVPRCCYKCLVSRCCLAAPPLIALVTLPAYCILVLPRDFKLCVAYCARVQYHIQCEIKARHSAWCNSRSAQWKVYSTMTASETFLSITLRHENPNRFQVTSHHQHKLADMRFQDWTQWPYDVRHSSDTSIALLPTNEGNST
jgi:hypothetical protein